jgi:uncharacterized membrane protein
MNIPHLHILLNHVPTVGFSLGVALFVAALLSKSQDLKRASLAILFFIAVLSTAVYISGKAAVEGKDGICPAGECMPGIAQPAIAAHEDMAFLAFGLMQLTGAFAFIGLWRMRRTSFVGAGTSAAVLVLGAVTFALMANAATIGGEIRHPEIVAGPRAPAEEGVKAASEGEPKPAPEGEAPAAPQAEAKPAPEAEAKTEPAWYTPGYVKALVNGATWIWPASETLHFLGLSLLFSVVLVVDLRILGMGKQLATSTMHKLLPWGMLGFGINLITGMMFFIAAPDQYIGNWVFFWKIVFIVLAGVNALYFLALDEAWTVAPNGNAPLRSKVAAFSAIVLWIMVLFWGHMLPFLGTSF